MYNLIIIVIEQLLFGGPCHIWAAVVLTRYVQASNCLHANVHVHSALLEAATQTALRMPQKITSAAMQQPDFPILLTVFVFLHDLNADLD